MSFFKQENGNLVYRNMNKSDDGKVMHLTEMVARTVTHHGVTFGEPNKAINKEKKVYSEKPPYTLQAGNSTARVYPAKDYLEFSGKYYQLKGRNPMVSAEFDNKTRTMKTELTLDSKPLKAEDEIEDINAYLNPQNGPSPK